MIVVLIQCGLGNTHDQLKPACVSALSGVKVTGIAAGLWHTLCISAEGQVYAFGGNQFGQLGTGSDQAEVDFFLPFGLITYSIPGRDQETFSLM